MEDWRLAMCPAAEVGYELRCLMGEIINSAQQPPPNLRA
jgi:hypothetical protein